MTITSFIATGAVQTFVVPTSVTSLVVSGRGGDGGRAPVIGSPSGRGITFAGTLTVTPGETLHLYVGTAGGSAGSPSSIGTHTAGWPDGGAGGVTANFNHGAGGGGSTRIYRGLTPLLILAGGGGSAGRPNTYTVIGDATDPTTNAFPGGPSAADGGGATTVAGGAAGVSGSPGGSLFGGAGQSGSGSQWGGGGGGGGLFGGGGGGKGGPVQGGRGGGGVSYISGSGWTSPIWTPGTGSVVELVSLRTGFPGSLSFTYTLPTVGGWSVGIVKQMG